MTSDWRCIFSPDLNLGGKIVSGKKIQHVDVDMEGKATGPSLPTHGVIKETPVVEEETRNTPDPDLITEGEAARPSHPTRGVISYLFSFNS